MPAFLDNVSPRAESACPASSNDRYFWAQDLSPRANPITSPASLITEPRFSVLVAVFNEADNVAAVTEEILRATAPLGPFELIYVDDGSTDATAERLRAIRGAGRSIRVLRRDRR